MNKKISLFIAAFALAVSIAHATAGEWPQKALQIICGANPGGDSDFNSRAIAEFLTRELGEPVVVVNVPGAGMTVGVQQAHDAAPDGYSVGFAHVTFLINQLTGMLDFGFDDMEVVAGISQNAGDILVVNKNSGWKTIADLVNAAKAEPFKYSMSGDVGSTSYIEALMFADTAGIQFNMVSGGDASTKSTELLGGQIDSTILPYGTALPYLQSGDFLALGVFLQERNPKFPDIPTFVEQGYDAVFITTYFLFLPKGTPESIVEKLRTAVKKATEYPEYAAMIDKAYSQAPKYIPPEDLIALFDNLKERIAPFVE